MRHRRPVSRLRRRVLVRVTVDQNLVIRWVPVGDVRELYASLSAASSLVLLMRRR